MTDNCIDSGQAALTFGKYKGQQIIRVAARNAAYLLWAHENVSFFKLSPRLLRVFVGLAENQQINRAADLSMWRNPDFIGMNARRGHWDDIVRRAEGASPK